jgi:putative membrane-bound dehydrogenase-like protein
LVALVGGLAVGATAKEWEVHRFERQALTNTYFSEGTAVGDLNNDGHQDVVYGPHWYEGPGFTRAHEFYPAAPQPTEKYADHFFAWVYDFDADGHRDILTVGFPGTPAYVYRNPGKVDIDKAWEKIQVFDWVSNESPQWTNLVGDDRPELVCTRDGFFGYAQVDWEQPFRAWVFHPISEKIAPERFGHGLGVGDVNGDGRMDILRASGWFEQPPVDAAQPRWRDHPARFTNAGGGAEMYAYDVDGDGDNDIISSLAAHEFGLSWFEQKPQPDGQRSFEEHRIMGSHPADSKYGVLFSELHSLQLADIDGDGLKDIVTGKTYYSHHRQSPMWDSGAVVYWFKLVRDEQGVDWKPYQADDRAGIGRQLVVHDIDADGLLDIATGGMLGAHVLLQRRQVTDEPGWLAAQPQLYHGPPAPAKRSIAAADPPQPRLPSDPKRLEAEAWQVAVTGGSTRIQAMGGFASDRWSGNQQLWWTGAKPGHKLTFTFESSPEMGALDLVLTKARNYAIVKVMLDERILDEQLDLYAEKVVTTGVLRYPTPDLPPGKHTLTLEIIRANPGAQPAFMVGVDYLRQAGKDDPLPSPTRPAGGKLVAAPEVEEIAVVDENGRSVNLDFETGDLSDWKAEGEAFQGQPVEGDLVEKRRPDMRSQHRGRFWIGGFEKMGDQVKGTLTSIPFRASARFASFWFGGGSSAATRVELYAVGEDKPFFQISGRNREDMERVVVELRRVQEQRMYIRLVDEGSGGWGHLNFDHFRLHHEPPGKLTTPSNPLVADDYPHQGLPADAAAAAMKVPEGFRVTACAAEPDVQQPIAMALDDRGRLWVAEAYEYPVRAKGDQGRDRILIFEDRDGDDRFESRRVFAEGLNLVSGLEVGFGGVWVGAAPYLLFIPDRDGNDVPDDQPQILLDGWGYEDTHETLNAFRWGPDGWLYGCHGVFTHSRVGKPGTKEADRIPLNAGVWRYHPVQHRFEVFAHGTSNPWGVDFDQYGEAFVTACVIPHLFHMIPGARYHRQSGQHFNPHTYQDIKTIADHLHYLGATPHGGNGKSDEAGGGHAHCGAMIYQGAAWPKEYAQAIFMNNIHGQRLNVDHLKPEGSGYVGTHGKDFLLTGDMASQIINLRYGPDGQVILIDWYDMQACHSRDASKHDRSNGRIYKISYGSPQSLPRDLVSSSDLQLVELALHPNDWYVEHARRLLQERSMKQAIDAAAVARLRQLALEHQDVTRRLRAVWALHVIQALRTDDFQRLLQDPHPNMRGWAVRLSIESQGPKEASLAQWKAMAAEPSPVVRLSMAAALQRIPPASRWPWLEAMPLYAEDREDHNLPLMYWYAAEPMADIDPVRALGWAMKAGEQIPLLREFMLRRIASQSDSQSLAHLMPVLQQSDSQELQLVTLQAIRTALAGQRGVAKPAAWDAIYDRLSTSSAEAVKRNAAELGTVFGDQRAMGYLRSLLRSSAVAEEERVQALKALLSAKDPALAIDLLEFIRSSGAAPGSALRIASIQGLAQYDHGEISPVLLEVYPGLSPSEKAVTLSTLCSRISSARALLEAIEQGRVPVADLSADMARRIEFLNDAAVNALLGKVWGQVRSSPAEKRALIERYQALVADRSQPPADIPFGRAIFAKTCQRCHMLYGIGQKLGPDLTGSNRSNIDYLLENIVDPSAVMANEYRQTILLMEGGQVVTGILKGETDKTITLQTTEATVTLPKDEIEERRVSEKSMMPDDQLQAFSPHEVRSLIAYLRGTQQSPMLVTAENTMEFFNQRDLSGWQGDSQLWTVADGEIVGKSSGLKRNEFLISDLVADDFTLSLEMKLVDNAGNSGIQFRSQVLDNGSVAGYQADVGIGWWGKLYEEHGRKLLWDKSGESAVQAGAWNRYKIEAQGSRIRTWINDQACVDLDDPAGQRRGVFAIQLHSGGPTEVRVRNLKLTVP